ncbi:hypothetical protein ACTFSJ_27715 [Bacillus cereus group sp. MYBK12-2]|uniref:hypothetical protein n=1 Tax=Bacillus cereus group sp. MYBK12-2 TaxID=3450689 RepID=UPI0032FA827E|nr:hypothetical protein [Bacillus pacificus]HDR7653592.1 hypothetical protein [Bacillus pacificus]
MFLLYAAYITCACGQDIQVLKPQINPDNGDFVYNPETGEQMFEWDEPKTAALFYEHWDTCKDNPDARV